MICAYILLFFGVVSVKDEDWVTIQNIIPSKTYQDFFGSRISTESLFRYQ
jgi:hypothetical protein